MSFIISDKYIISIQLRWLIQCLIIILLGVSTTGCADTGVWKEEVKLSDGRVIVVEQKRRYEGVYTGQDIDSVVREAWLKFNLPEFSDQEITWHENLMPRILNIHAGNLFIVGWPPTGREFDQYGKQRPPYISFLYENKKWRRIPLSEIPHEVYDTNLWIENMPPNNTDYISFEDKEGEMHDPELDWYHKKIDPAYKVNF